MQKWKYFTTDEVKPLGWIKRQLEIQAQGLSGNLDKVWPDVRDSAWIGGKAEGWERVPYWLDGFVPLAYLLEDKDMQNRAKRYIDGILARQQESGWICPCKEEEIPTYDTWAVQLISKTLTLYYQCSKDERIPTALYRLMKNYYELLESEKIKLFDWGKYRWYEAFIAIQFLWERTGEEWLKSLAKILWQQGIKPGEIISFWEKPERKWQLPTHIVNICMLLKYQVVARELLGDCPGAEADFLQYFLEKHHGTAVGLFTGDECLSGLSPIQGTELCAVVEQMFSYEQLFAHTGEEKWLDKLEMLAFNALPATLSDDMWAHQYVQLSNQIACVRFEDEIIFGTNGREAHLFGLEPHYGCCTANFSQGFPKFVLSAFAQNGENVISTMPIPGVLDAPACRIEVISDYPFKNTARYKIKARENVRVTLRVPTAAKNLRVNGLAWAGNTFILPCKAGDEREITLAFDLDTEVIPRPNGLNAVQRGSLVFALPVEYEKVKYEYVANGIERKFPYCDYEYVGKSDWNYALTNAEFTVEEREVSEVPFSSQAPAVVLKANVQQIPWGTEKNYASVCAKIPASCMPIGEREEKALYPYGNAKLRVTELPFVSKKA